MSTSAQTKNSPRFLMVLLLGLAVLNISSFMSETMSERTMASEDGDEQSEDLGNCNLEALNKPASDKTGNAPSVNCDMAYETNNDGMTKGRAKVRKLKDSGSDYFEVVVETECETCSTGFSGGSPLRVDNTEDLENLKTFITQKFKVKAVKKIKATKEQKKRIAKVAQCLVAPLEKDRDLFEGSEDEYEGEWDGHKLNKKESRECAIRKIKSETLEGDDASELFEKHVKKEIKALLESGSPEDLARAKELLEELNGAGLTGAFGRTVEAMNRVLGLKTQINSITDRLQGMNPNDPGYKQLMTQLQMLQTQAGVMFNGAIRYEQNVMPLMQDGYQQSQILINDLRNWQAEIQNSQTQFSNSLNTVVDQHGQIVNQNGQPMDLQNRGARGQVNGQPVVNGSPMPNNGTLYNNPGLGAPQMGSQVNGNSYQQQPGMMMGPNGQPMQMNSPQQMMMPRVGQQMAPGQQMMMPPPGQQMMPPPGQQMMPPPGQQYRPGQPLPTQYMGPGVGPNGQGGFPPLGQPGGQPNGMYSPLGTAGCGQVPGAIMPPGYCGVPRRYY